MEVVDDVEVEGKEGGEGGEPLYLAIEE